MNRLLILFSFLICLQSDTTVVSWHENHKLKWTDFQAKPDTSSNAAAVTASGITFSYTIQKSNIRGINGFKTKVFAHFYPEHSWCKKELIDNHILKHEQFHFNITELHVRYLRKKISKLKPSKSIVKELDALHKQANIDLDSMQKRYDEESNYSINKQGQQKWIVFVNNELKKLEEYKSK